MDTRSTASRDTSAANRNGTPHDTICAGAGARSWSLTPIARAKAARSLILCAELRVLLRHPREIQLVPFPLERHGRRTDARVARVERERAGFRVDDAEEPAVRRRDQG